jgi:flagellar biogenesis protein FliO
VIFFATLAIAPSAARGAESSGAGDSEPVRVPPPSGRLLRGMTGAGSPDAGARSSAQGGWWMGSAGIALALAATGALCTLARKRWPSDSSKLLRVIGKVSLSPRHSICLVQAGQRVLLIGTGAGGAPSLLGELSAAELAPTPGEPRAEDES